MFLCSKIVVKYNVQFYHTFTTQNYYTFLCKCVAFLLRCVVIFCVVNFGEISKVHPNCVQTAFMQTASNYIKTTTLNCIKTTSNTSTLHQNFIKSTFFKRWDARFFEFGTQREIHQLCSTTCPVTHNCQSHCLCDHLASRRVIL